MYFSCCPSLLCPSKVTVVSQIGFVFYSNKSWANIGSFNDSLGWVDLNPQLQSSPYGFGSNAVLFLNEYIQTEQFSEAKVCKVH